MDYIQNDFNLASDLDKQIITLSTGIRAISIDFTKDMGKRLTKFGIQILLYCAWVCYLFAICAGLITMGKLTSASLMANQSIGGATESLNSVMPVALLEEGIFLLGVFFTLAYGVGAGFDAAKRSRTSLGNRQRLSTVNKQNKRLS